MPRVHRVAPVPLPGTPMIDKTLVRPVNRASARAPAAPGLDDISAALQALPHGGLDESTRRFAVPPAARATLAPLVGALRWAAVAFAMIFSTKQALRGDLGAVVGLSMAVFITAWRTILPLRLGSAVTSDRVVAITDTALLGAALGYAAGPENPLVASVLVAVAVAALGWGYAIGGAAAVAAYVGMLVGAAIDGHAGRVVGADALAFVVALVVVVILLSIVRAQLLSAERRRRELAGRLDALAETNDLLTMLNSVARTLPASLNQREAIESIRDELLRPFQPTVICLVEYDDAHDEWTPKLAEGCVLKPACPTDELPVSLASVIGSPRPLLRNDLASLHGEAISSGSGSGLYTELRSRGRLVALLGLEHPLTDHYGDRDRRLLGGLADLLALTLDNARRFGRLRSLGAEEERTRIARDLHDRLGQWLTFISFELERIIADGTDSAPELSRLYQDVQRTLEELRETLRQLRSEVTGAKPLATVGRELVARFVERTDIDVVWKGPSDREHLPIGVENELLRILQESLSNIDKHAHAEHAWVTWMVDAGTGTLTIRDDGRGFDTSRGVRDNAYGLVGMRERADAIGARLNISSTPDDGTTVTVVAGSTIPPSKEA